MINNNVFPNLRQLDLAGRMTNSLDVFVIAAGRPIQQRLEMVELCFCCPALRPHFSLIFWQKGLFAIFFHSES